MLGLSVGIIKYVSTPIPGFPPSIRDELIVSAHSKALAETERYPPNMEQTKAARHILHWNQAKSNLEMRLWLVLTRSIDMPTMDHLRHLVLTPKRTSCQQRLSTSEFELAYGRTWHRAHRKD